MTKKSVAVSLALMLAPCFVATPLCRAAVGECLHCPKTVFCRPKPPRIKYKCVCPMPICPLCEIENFGYYPTCWRAWPFPPNYSHCPVPPTIMTAPCCPNGAPKILEQLPVPHMLPTSPSLQ
jgi:hypothetical protein